MYTITVSEKGGQQSAYEFSKAEITIGRMKGNDIVLPKGNVSKRHSRISSQDGTFRVVDLDSTNGTYVNGRKIAGEQPIGDADKIYIGDFILQIESAAGAFAGAPAPPPPAPPSFGSSPVQGMPAPPSGDIPTNDLHDNHFGGAPDPFGQQPSDDPFGGNVGFGSGDGMPPGPPAPPAPAPPTPAPPAPPAPGPAAQAAPSSFGDSLLGGGAVDFGAPAPPGTSHDFALDEAAAPTPVPAPARPSVSARVSTARDEVAERPRAERFGQAVSHVGTILAANELVSEFDAAHQAARHDVATVLFERVSPDDLPLDYPPTKASTDKFRAAVKTAVKTVKPNVDHDTLIDQLTAECVGLGPIDAFLDDPNVRDIFVNRADFVLIRRDAGLVRSALAFSHPLLLTAAAHRLLGPRDNEILTDELRFNDGTRVHVALPPIAPDGAVISIRKPPASHPTLEELVTTGALTGGMAEFLDLATQGGRSILIAGPSGSGKSTLLSALSQQIATGVRVVGIDNGGHLKLGENSIRLEPNPGAGFDARRLLHSALAMHPQRIVLDECRGAEAYDWVTAAASGTEGSLATIHGTSAAEALGKLESLSLMAAANIAPRGLREQVARAVNLVVVVNRNHDGKFRVHQITEVQGVDLDAFRLNDVFYYRVEGTEGRFHPTGYVPQFFEDMRHAGVDVDFGIFRE